MGQLKNMLIEEIKLRGLSIRTQEAYIQSAKKFISFTKKPSSKLSLEEVRRYKLHLIAANKAPSTINKEMSALKFFLYSFLGFNGITTALNH